MLNGLPCTELFNCFRTNNCSIGNETRTHNRLEVFFFFFFFFFFVFLGLPPWAYGGSHARGPVGAVATSLHHRQQCQIWAVSAAYTTDHGNTRSSTHWARPGIEPSSSWMLVRFVNCWATTGTPEWRYLNENVLLKLTPDFLVADRTPHCGIFVIG